MVNKTLFLYGFLISCSIILQASHNNEKNIVFDNEQKQLKKLFHSNYKDNTNALINYTLLKKKQTKPIHIIIGNKLYPRLSNINNNIIFSNESAQLKAYGEIKKNY